MVEKKLKEKFFLFNIVKPKMNLKRDEMKLISKIAYSAVAVMIIIDLIAIIFFIKTNERIEKIVAHDYTQEISKNLELTTGRQEEYALKTTEIIQQKENHLKEFIKRIEFTSTQMNKLNPGRVNLANLEKMQSSMENFLQDPKNPDMIRSAINNYNILESEMIRMNNYLMPLKGFHTYTEQLETYMRYMLKEVDKSLKNYLNQLGHLSNSQSFKQNKLITEVNQTLNSFDTYYKSMVKFNRYKKLNNFYKIKFINFDQNFIPFSKEFETGAFGSQLTETSEFDLRLPRVYFCNLRAQIKSENIFNVSFEYVDALKEDNKVLFATRGLGGGFRHPVSYNEFKVFELPKGPHKLYLRTVSDGSASQVHMNNLRMECLSYRNFKHDEEEEY